tara:strand:- start:910 stop:1161 length:252 start_codon:yes stop_codon:yes gene_type:complete
VQYLVELNVIHRLNLMDSQTQSVTRYRVTLDFTVSEANCVPPSNWNWNELLELNDKNGERVKTVYVENLGQIAIRKYNTKEAV